MQEIPTLGSKVCKYHLHWAIWIPSILSIQVSILAGCLVAGAAHDELTVLSVGLGGPRSHVPM